MLQCWYMLHHRICGVRQQPACQHPSTPFCIFLFFLFFWSIIDSTSSFLSYLRLICALLPYLITDWWHSIYSILIQPQWLMAYYFSFLLTLLKFLPLVTGGHFYRLAGVLRKVYKNLYWSRSQALSLAWSLNYSLIISCWIWKSHHPY